MSADEEKQRLIETLRAKDEALPERFEFAPVMDRWTFNLGDRGGLFLWGTISGDARFKAGTSVHTTEIQAIDGVLTTRWCRTKNTLYRLGWPDVGLTPAAAVALAATWPWAASLAGLSTGEHTLSAEAREIYKRLPDIAEDDWKERRMTAVGLAARLRIAGRDSIADAWTLLAADLNDKESAVAAAGLLATALAAGRAGDRVSEIAALLKVWEAAREGAIKAQRSEDHIAAAHRLAKQPPEPDWSKAKARILVRRTSSTPLFVRLAMQRTWQEARDLLLAELPVEAREAVDELNEREINSVIWWRRREAARDLAKRVGLKGYAKHSHCFRLLAVKPDEPHDVKWAHAMLKDMIAGTGNVERALLAGWEQLAEYGSYPTPHSDDPFAATWHLSAHHGAAKVGNDLPPPEDDNAPTVPGGGVVVLPRLGGTSKSSSGREVDQEFREIVGKNLPLLCATDLARARANLFDEFPHLTAEIDLLLTGPIEGEPIRFPPTLLAGEPGGGKSRLARRLAEELRITLHRFDGSGSSDNAFGGTPRRWSSGEHCVPLEAVRRARAANPFLLIDEIDKAGNSRHNGSLDRALLPFLEPENARAYPDPYVQSEVDLSHVNYLLTANDATVLPGPFRDRLRIVTLPRPGIEHLPQLTRAIVADVAKTRGGDARWYPMLDDGELAVAESLWRGGSVRRLRAIVERILAHRERKPRN